MQSVGIIGVGYWGPNYARILSSLSNVEFRWCCDLNETALSKMQTLYPKTKTTTKMSDLLTDDTLDAVIVVTPAQTHADIVKKFLESGKHVLVEKPLTTSTSHAKKLIEISKKKRKILMVDHTFVFNSAVSHLQKIIKSGELGKILYGYGEYNALGPIRKDVSAMWDLPHFLYVANFLFESTPTHVSANGRSFYQKGMEDVVFITLEYPDKSIFNLSCSWIDPVKIRKFTLVGNKKMAVFDDMVHEGKLTIFDKGVEVSKDPNFANLGLILRNGDVTIPFVPQKEPLTQVVLTFLEACTKGKLDISTAKDGLSLVQILEAAQKSLDSNGKKIKL